MIRPRIIHPANLRDVGLEDFVLHDPRFKDYPPDLRQALTRELSNKVRYAEHEGYSRIRDIKDLGEIFPRERKLISVLNEQGDPFYSYLFYRYGKADHGEMNESETFLLAFMVRALQPKVMVEYGTFYGRTTRIMAEESQPGARVITVDLPQKQRAKHDTNSSVDRIYTWHSLYRIGEKYEQSNAREKIRQLYIDVRKREFVTEMDRALEGEPIDLAVFDCAHDYKTVKRLFEFTLPRMSRGGVLFFDDTNKPQTHAGTNKLLIDRAIVNGDLVYLFQPAYMSAVEPSAGFMINDPLTMNGRWRNLLK